MCRERKAYGEKEERGKRYEGLQKILAETIPNASRREEAFSNPKKNVSKKIGLLEA